MNQKQHLIKKYGLDGKSGHMKTLNAACPVAQVNETFSPELVARHAAKDADNFLKSPLLWECLCCGLCEELSNGEVAMSSFVKEMRAAAFKQNNTGTETHGGMLLSTQRMNALSSLKPKRTRWIPETLKVTYGQGTHIYWAGGAPFFNALLPAQGDAALGSARAAIRLINCCGVTPVLMPQERFSGHDLLYTGDRDNFKKLAVQNAKAIRGTRAQTIVVSSPEDCHTLKNDYGEYLGNQDITVLHITEFLFHNIRKLKFKPLQKKVTYHDPCNLGRGLGVYEAPRKLLQAIPGIELIEMENAKEKALCCGTSCWTNCNRYSKLMQVARLQEAAAIGADMLVTSCWECTIHFTCTMQSSAWQQVTIDVRDLITLLAQQLLDY